MINAHLTSVRMRAAPENTTYAVVTSSRLYNRGKDFASQLDLILSGRRTQPAEPVKILGITIEANSKDDT